MARKKHSELTAGIFVVAALALTLGVVIWLGGGDVFKPAKQHVCFYARAGVSPGLAKSSSVQYGGLEVGRIIDIRLQTSQKRSLYIAEIFNPDLDVHDDANTQIVAGLVGQSSIALINTGTEARPPADEQHPLEVTGGGVEAAVSAITAAAQNLQVVSEKLAVEFDANNHEALLGKVHGVIDNINLVTASFAKATNLADSNSLLARAVRGLADIQEMIASAKPKLDKTFQSLQNTAGLVEGYAGKDVPDAIAKIQKVLSDFESISKNANQMITVNRDKIDKMIDNMTLVSANLKATATEVRRNPWRLLNKPDKEDIRSQNLYDAARAFYGGAEQLNQSLATLNALAKSAPQGVTANDPQLEKARKQLQESFDRFKSVEDSLWKELSK